jgi:8-oxo-dGTP pyrophosphatase MutT (NUDIX family)/ribosomal protein S18 acetylase RimI-like enzyme
MDGTELRSAIAADVAARRPVDAREREAIAEFGVAFAALAEPFSETADRVHVTASAIVVADPPGSSRHGVVLHRHKRLGLWLQPGGHIDPGELPWDAARREAQEETGLAVTLVAGSALAHVDVHPGPRRHRHLDLRYVVSAPPDPPNPPAEESQDVAWFAWRDAIGGADPGLEGVLRAMQPGSPRLRPARTRDAAGMARVLVRSRAFALPDVPSIHREREIVPWCADELIGHFDVWVADIDDVVVGLLALTDGWIDQLYLDPAWIGRGLGERFMQLAVQRQPGGLQLWTFQANVAAQRFYARHGFREVERTDGAGNEERAPDIRMQLDPSTG